MKTLKALNKLVNSGTEENINMAFRQCEKQGLRFEGLESVRKYVPIIKWLSDYLDGYDDIKEGLVKAINIECLDLRSKKLKSLPKSIGNLPNLKELDLSYNKIKKLPKSMGDLVNLTFLFLDGNKLTKLPKSIVKLKHLKWIELRKQPTRPIRPNNKSDSPIKEGRCCILF